MEYLKVFGGENGCKYTDTWKHSLRIKSCYRSSVRMGSPRVQLLIEERCNFREKKRINLLQASVNLFHIINKFSFAEAAFSQTFR